MTIYVLRKEKYKCQKDVKQQMQLNVFFTTAGNLLILCAIIISLLLLS